MRPEMPAGSLEPMRPDPRVRGPVPSHPPAFGGDPRGVAPPRSTSTGVPTTKSWEGPLDLQISRPALRSHLI